MKREYVSSSNISSIGYDENASILEIEFSDGIIYQYFGVSSQVFVSLKTACSIGSYFHKHIKQNYQYKRI